MIKKNFLRIIIITLFILLINIKITNAAISVPSKTVNSGENFSILVSSNIPVVSYKVTMTANGGVNFVTSSGGTGEGTATITDAKSTGMTSLATYTFKAPTVTTDTTYTISFSATIMEDENFNAVADDTAVATIQVKAPVMAVDTPSEGTPTNGGASSGGESTTTKPSNTTSNETKPTQAEEKKSSDADLKEINVEGFSLSPEFSPNIKEYTLTVPYEVTSLNVTAVKSDSKATYRSSGDEDLKVGENEVLVNVRAEDGTKNVYTIIVTRANPDFNLNKLKVTTTNKEGIITELPLKPEFSFDIFEYELDNISYEIDKLDIEAIANLEEAIVEIEGNENLKTGENKIKVTVKMPMEAEEGEEAEYEIKTYTITVKKEKEPVEVTSTTQGSFNDWFKENKEKVIAGTLLICAGAVVGLTIYYIIDYRKYQMLISKIAELNELNEAELAKNRTAKINETPIENELKSHIEINEEKDIEKNKKNGRHF